MNVAFTGQQAAADFDIPGTLQKVYGAQLTLQVVQSAGAGSDAVTVSASLDGTNYVTLNGTDLSDGSAATSAAASGMFRFDVTGFDHVRISKGGTTDTFSVYYNYCIG